MSKSNTNYSMLATHVNDLRRMWFAEHEKNRKLKAKMKEFKNIMKSIQAQFSFNDSFIDESFVAVGHEREFSNQSTLEQTINFQCFQQRLISSIQKFFLKIVRETFFCIKKHSKSKVKETQNVRIAKLLINLGCLGYKKEIYAKVLVFGLIKNGGLKGKFRIFDAFLKVLKKIKAAAFAKLKNAQGSRFGYDSFTMDYDECVKNTNYRVNETSKLNIRNYFAPLCSLEDNEGEYEYASFADSCFGSTEQVRKKLNSKIDLERHKKIIKNPKFLNFLQIFREKISEKENLAFQSIVYIYENSICYQEGAKLLLQTLKSALDRKEKHILFSQIKKFSQSKKIFNFYLSQHLLNIGKSFRKSILLSIAHQSLTPQKKFSVNFLNFKLKFIEKKICRPAFQALKSSSMLKDQNIAKSLTQLLQALENFSALTIKSSLQASFKSIKVFKTSAKPCLNKFFKLLSDYNLLKISVAFRFWQHKIYSLQYSCENKENYYKRSLNFSNIQTKTQTKSQPLRVLKRSYFN